MDISNDAVMNILAVDAISRAILAADVSGVSVHEKTIIHLLDGSQANQDIANAILDNYGDLTVTADKTTMTEGDADPVVTCADSAISGDSNVGYIVLLDGDEYASGTDTVTAGEAELTLTSPVAGVYEIFVYRLEDDYMSGSVTITVDEA